MLKIALVGTGGMMPMPNRYLSSAILSSEGKLLLIDCGEGTQVSLKTLGWGMKAIDIICLTHYHADHTAGLPGLLSTIGNSGKTTPLTIIGPVGLKAVIEGLTVIVPALPFEIHLIELYSDDILDFTIGNYTIKKLDVEHHIPTLAYSIEIKRNNKFCREKAEKNNVPMKLWNTLQKGNNIEFEGTTYTPDMVLGEIRKGLKISYCTDSRPVDSLVDFINESDLFICEGMYGDDEFLDKAKDRKHMIFSEAAKLAKQGNVKEMWLTHYSPAMQNPEDFLQNAKKIFENTIAGYDGMWKEINFIK